MAARAAADFGPLNIMVNNAAIQLHGQDGPCHAVSLDVWERTMAVNLRGPFLGAKHALPALMPAAAAWSSTSPRRRASRALARTRPTPPAKAAS